MTGSTLTASAFAGLGAAQVTGVGANRLLVYQDGNSLNNEGSQHSMAIVSNQGTAGGQNQMIALFDADFTNQCCSIQSIVINTKTTSLSLNPRGGNIGIGVTNPSQKLTVASGNILMSIEYNFYLYYISSTNYASLSTDSGGTMYVNTGTGGVGARLSIAPGGLLTVNNGATINNGLTVAGSGASNGILFAGRSSNRIYVGDIDTYNPTGLNNLMINSWFGIGFSSYDGTVRAAIDTRTGNASFSGTVTAALFSGNISVIPVGIIVMWYGTEATIPTGWRLCNGAYSTPDLRSRFVVCAGSGGSYSPGDTGGANEVTLTVAQMPAHSHSMDMRVRGNENGRDEYTLSTGGTTYTTTVGGNAAHENRPPYYALCYIMKV